MSLEIILDELEQAQRDYEVIRQDAELARALRNASIKLALATGVKQADIARITGLSRARIAQLR